MVTDNQIFFLVCYLTFLQYLKCHLQWCNQNHNPLENIVLEDHCSFHLHLFPNYDMVLQSKSLCLVLLILLFSNAKIWISEGFTFWYFLYLGSYFCCQVHSLKVNLLFKLSSFLNVKLDNNLHSNNWMNTIYNFTYVLFSVFKQLVYEPIYKL